MKKLITFSLVMIALLTIAGCGQKGPLELETPEPEVAPVQEQELSPTN
ncbi:MAG: lipoprotein [Gammaproteobacteria bacterium]|nr:lipoprotein [Gammaproteobacteria bacterium]